jgi:hypothetical protein
MAKTQSSDQEQQESGWDRAYNEVERSRKTDSTPDTSGFKDLTKSVGSNK